MLTFLKLNKRFMGLKKQDFFRQLAMTSQYTFHEQPRTFFVFQFHCHFVTRETTLGKLTSYHV